MSGHTFIVLSGLEIGPLRAGRSRPVHIVNDSCVILCFLLDSCACRRRCSPTRRPRSARLGESWRWLSLSAELLIRAFEASLPATRAWEGVQARRDKLLKRGNKLPVPRLVPESNSNSILITSILTITQQAEQHPAGTSQDGSGGCPDGRQSVPVRAQCSRGGAAGAGPGRRRSRVRAIPRRPCRARGLYLGQGVRFCGAGLTFKGVCSVCEHRTVKEYMWPLALSKRTPPPPRTPLNSRFLVGNRAGGAGHHRPRRGGAV